MKKFEKGSEVKFQNPITKQWHTSKVYDTDYQGDPANWRVQVKIGEGALVFKLASDCTEVENG